MKDRRVRRVVTVCVLAAMAAGHCRRDLSGNRQCPWSKSQTGYGKNAQNTAG